MSSHPICARLSLATVVLVGVRPMVSLADESTLHTTEQIKSTPYVVWYGDDEVMTVERFVSYCAPILWF